MTDDRVSLVAALRAAAAATEQITGGDVAQYIPRLAQVDPEQFALAVCTTAGHVEIVGDGETGFSLQSTSKPFVYGAALDRLGREQLRTKVGVEPTGRSFDSLVRLETGAFSTSEKNRCWRSACLS